MRKRDKLKRVVRQVLRRPSATDVSDDSERAAAHPAETALREEPLVEPPPPVPPPTPPIGDSASSSGSEAESPSPKPDGPASTSADDEEAAKAAEMAAKAAKHFERTRRAMLKLVVDQGGTASLADMHERSERRYFIGHKRFSTLMEGLVDEGLIDFDHATGTAAITKNGRQYIEST